MKNIVIFGAMGDLGKAFLKYILQQEEMEFKITATTHNRNIDNPSEYPSVNFVNVDISTKKGFELLPTSVYAVIDFAGMLPAKMDGYNPQKYIDTNITGTLNILDYCQRTSADRILFMQSFGDIKNHGDDKILLTPDLPRNMYWNDDHTVYVLSKNFAVDLLRNYHAKYGIKPFIFRLPNIYMYYDNEGYYLDGILHRKNQFILIEKALYGEPLEVWGNPKRVRDMVYVKDFLQMLAKALSVNRDGGHYNVGTGVGTSILDQIKGIIEVFGNNNAIIYRPDKPDTPQYIMDITSAIIELDYHPVFFYKKMLYDMKTEMTRRKHA